MYRFLEPTTVWDDAATRDWNGLQSVVVLDTPVAGPPRSLALRRLGNYELLRKIGSGGMAQVWMGRRATLEGASKAVAVKLLLGDLSEEGRYRQMFVDETKLTMLLSHSNVVQVFDAGESDGQYYLVMEWIDGRNLAEVVRDHWSQGRAVSLSMAGFIVGEVLRGLAYAHTLTHDGVSQCIVHRDVSPQNVLVSVSGEVKIVDFGVARLARDETSGFHVRGKLRYMAPEQLSGHSRHPTVDLYAVGAMLHELLDGEKFRDARDETHLYAQVASGEIPRLKNPDIPRELDRLREALLCADASARVQSAEEALRLLMRWPGYRNASLELAELLREQIGIDAPRSGVHVASRSGQEPVAMATPRPRDAASSARAETVTRARDSVATLVETRAPARPRSRALVVGTLLGTTVLGAGLAVLGIVWTESRGFEAAGIDSTAVALESSAVEVAAESTASETARVAKPPLVAASSQPLNDDAGTEAPEVASLVERPLVAGLPETASGKSGEVEVAPTPPSPMPTSVSGGGGAEPERSGVAAQKRRRATRVDVRFKAGDFKFVYLRVGGRELVAEPVETIKLAPGRHRVQMRDRRDAPWTRAGTLRVEPGVTHVVRMTKPNGMSVARER